MFKSCLTGFARKTNDLTYLCQNDVSSFNMLIYVHTLQNVLINICVLMVAEQLSNTGSFDIARPQNYTGLCPLFAIFQERGLKV